MAKKISPKATTKRRGSHFRKVPAFIEVARMPSKYGSTPTSQAFLACVKVAGNMHGLSGASTTSCAPGKNPRKAIAAALKKASNAVGKRSGAFAGMR